MSQYFQYITRSLTSALRRAAKTFPAVLVTGARQTGKTTLLRKEFAASHRYVSLDHPDLRQRAQADPNAFLAENPSPIILDEIQRAPFLLPYIKQAIDLDRRPGQWLLTGSQKFSLMQGVSETLAGRVAILELGPFSVAESQGHEHEAPPTIDALVDRVFAEPHAVKDPPEIELVDWILRGAYPEPRMNPDVDRQLWFSSYVQTYLERDVRDLLQVGDLSAFTQFLLLVAARSGTLINQAEFGREIGVSAPTIRRWLSVLETSQVVQLLPPFHRSFGKRIRKSPKLIVTDPGLVSFLVGLHDREAILRGPMLGALTETAVIGEWIKAFHNAGERANLYHWRSADGLEVDLIFERGGHLYGVEIKATATPTPEHADGLKRWMALAGPRAHGVVACRVEHPTTIRPGIRAVPWHLAW